MIDAIRWLIPALWLTLLAYWIYGATRAKRTLGLRTAYLGAGVRVTIIALALLAYRIPALRQANDDPTLTIVGTVICALGVGLAIVARTYLGRNWGMPASRKENPDLITDGPYRFIRHPIYTGILLAMLGTAIAESRIWLLVFVLFAAYFVYAAGREERTMAELFPEQYPAYKQRTKMLVPFVI